MLKSSWEITPCHVTTTGQIKLGEATKLSKRLFKEPPIVFQHVGTPRPPKLVVNITPHKRGESSVPFDHNGSLPLHKRIR